LIESVERRVGSTGGTGGSSTGNVVDPNNLSSQYSVTNGPQNANQYVA